MLQANQNQALLPSEKPRPSPSKPPLRRYAAFTPKAGERLHRQNGLILLLMEFHSKYILKVQADRIAKSSSINVHWMTDI
jgi:hypothetical protein